jgi:chromosome segregation ATPase
MADSDVTGHDPEHQWGDRDDAERPEERQRRPDGLIAGLRSKEKRSDAVDSLLTQAATVAVGGATIAGTLQVMSGAAATMTGTVAGTLAGAVAHYVGTQRSRRRQTAEKDEKIRRLEAEKQQDRQTIQHLSRALDRATNLATSDRASSGDLGVEAIRAAVAEVEQTAEEVYTTIDWCQDEIEAIRERIRSVSQGSSSDLPEQIDVLLNDAADLLRSARDDIRTGVAHARDWASHV